MKKLFYTLALLLLGLTTATAQEYKVGNVFEGTLELTHTQTWNDQTKDYPYTFDYAFTYLEDGKINVKANLTWLDGTPVGAIDEMFCDAPGGEIKLNRVNGETTTAGSLELGAEFTFIFRINAVAGDVVRTEVHYIAGAINEKKPEINVTTEVQNITTNSAEIAYTVTLPEGYNDASLDVTYEPGEYTVTKNPNKFTLSNLTPGTNYDFTFTVTATPNDGEPFSKTVKVSFSTLRDPNLEYHYYGIANGFLPSAYLIGENAETDKRDIPVSFKAELIYNANKTLTINFSVSDNFKNVVGSVMEVNVGGYSGDINPVDGIYTFTSPRTYEVGERELPWFHPKFAGGDARIELPWYTMEDTNDQVEYGQPVAVNIYTNNTVLTQGNKQWFAAYMTDDNGNFLLSEKPALSLKDDTADAEIAGDFITLNKKGKATLVASYNGLSAETVFSVPTSENAINLVSGKQPEVCDDSHIENPQNLTDGNEGTEFVFLCASGQEHSLTFDLGGLHTIELVKVVWEGASAKDYTITLADEKGNEEVYSIVDGEGGSGTTPRHNFDINNVVARYVTLTTTKAYEPAWNMKIKEFEVYGKEYNPGDWSGVPADDNRHSYSQDNVMPVFSNFYGKSNIPVYTSNNATVTHQEVGTKRNARDMAQALDAADDDTDAETTEYKVLLFNEMTVDDNVKINLNEDVTGAKVFNIDIYSTKVGTIYIDGDWAYGSAVSQDETEPYKIEITENDLNRWVVFNFDATDIGYGSKSQYDSAPITTIKDLIINSDIDSFLVDNCYFAGDQPLFVDTIEAAEGEAVYYNLQGVKVVNPERGIFVKVQNGKSSKVIL